MKGYGFSYGGDLEIGSYRSEPKKRTEPLKSKFKVGDNVRWAKPPSYNAEALKGYKAEHGNGPFEVLQTWDSTEEHIPPQIKIKTPKGSHVYGESWFVKAPREGETCECCNHKFERRTMFFSVDATPSCWCPE